MKLDVPMIVAFVKTNKYVVVPAALVLFCFLLVLSTTRGLQSPGDKLVQRIDAQVEKAQRMLYSYQPAGRRFLEAFEPSTTQPAELPSSNQWNDYLAYAEQESPFTDLLQRQSRQVRELAEDYARLSGEQRSTAKLKPTNPAEAYQQLKERMQRNQSLIDEALDIVQKAIGLSVRDGDETISGDAHPTATRLEAILIYRKAELLSQQAATGQAIADVNRVRFVNLMNSWQGLDSAINSLESGFTQEPSTQPANETQPAGAQEPKRPGAGTPTLAERIAKLEKQRNEVVAQINETQADNQRLQVAVEGLQKHIDEAQARASQAEQRMLALEQSEIDPLDPEALQTFIDEYQAASAIQRKASREVSILAFGSIRNAKPATDGTDEMLDAQLVAVDTGEEMTTERGLVVLQDELKAGQGLIQAQKQLLAGIDRQIEALSVEQKELTKRLAKLQSSRSELRDEASETVRSVVAASIESDELERQALDLLSNAGMQAASRARRAAEMAMRKTGSFIKAQNTSSPPDPTLSKMAADRNMIGHAKCVEGDIHYLTALINAQRATGFDHQHRMLNEAQRMGIAGDQNLLPKDQEPDSVSASLFQASAATAAAQETRKKAKEAAVAALGIYQEVNQSDLNRLWGVHTNMASVHYLLAGLESGQQAQAERDQARKMYEEAIQGRENLQQARAYQNIIEGLGGAAR